MIKIFSGLFFLSLCTTSHAQNKIYSAVSVPAELKKNAHSVKRDEQIEFEVRSADKAFYRVHSVVTVLNESGKEQLDFTYYSDKFQSLEDVTIQVLDETGKLKSKFTKSDFAKGANYSELVPDGKLYQLRVPASSFPLTIIEDSEIKYNGIFSYPNYKLQSPKEAVENSSFTAKVPVDLDMRFRPKGTGIAPAIGSEGKYKTYKWTVNKLPALEHEAGSVDGYPRILLGPNKFELDGYEGDQSSWKNFGLWYNSLVKNDNTLSPAFALEIRKMVNKELPDREKIKFLYSYLQKNFRYVSIQLGIGGLKPFAADFVHTKKYGDCKALSNYMQACLSALNIKSYSAWIEGSNLPSAFDADFPRDYFNHQILCVPLPKDTVWLECTSATNDFAVLGSFTENRQALLLTENGGVLIRTPTSKANENTFNSASRITLNEEGSGVADIMLNISGEFKQEFTHYIFNQGKDRQKKYIVYGMGFIQPDEFEIKHDKTNRDAATGLTMQLEKIPEFSTGSKMFLSPRIYKFWNYSLPKAENRTQDFYFEYPLIKTDTTIFILPQGFVPETLPKPRNIKFDYGSFTTSYSYDEKQKSIITTARLVLTQHRIPVAQFHEAKKFFNDVLEEYTDKVIIKRS
jgi:Domain of Unknown Function with PDB structure (DUF3857)